MQITSKLPKVGTTIFTVMSKLATDHQAINLAQGFPNFDCSPRLQNLVYHYLQAGFNQYAPMPGVPELRNCLAQKAERQYGRRPDPETEITITAGATQAIYTAIAAFVSSGDEVILLEPAYDCYGPSVEVHGGKIVPYVLKAPDYAVDWEAFANLVSPRTRMIIINTPHNPSGTIFKKADMEQLDRLTRNTNIIILSDEVYEHLVYDGEEHQSVLRFPELWRRSLVTYSFGKTLHCTGWKTGYCMGPEPLMKEFRKVHQYNVFSANHPLQKAIADYLADPEVYLSLNDFFEQKRDFFLQAMEGSRFRPLPCQGTYFQLFDYSSISDEPDVDFARRMTIEYGVAAIPVSVFYTNKRDDKVIRLCFAKTDEVLAEAAKLLQKI